jgi:F-type H+-transporting ATPase subunit alpha
MGVLLFAGNEGYLQDVDVAKIGAFEGALLSYMRAEHAELMQHIDADGDWTGDREASFKSAVEAFKSTQTW